MLLNPFAIHMNIAICRDITPCNLVFADFLEESVVPTFRL